MFLLQMYISELVILSNFVLDSVCIFLAYLSSTFRLTLTIDYIHMDSVWYSITTIPPSDFMGSNSHGYWDGKLMHRAGFDLAT